MSRRARVHEELDMFNGRNIRDALAPLGLLIILAGCLGLLEAIKSC